MHCTTYCTYGQQYGHVAWDFEKKTSETLVICVIFHGDHKLRTIEAFCGLTVVICIIPGYGLLKALPPDFEMGSAESKKPLSDFRSGSASSASRNAG
jgi:hypothetical protein